MQRFRVLVIVCILLGGLAIRPAVAADIVVGVNMMGVDCSLESQQNALVQQLQQNGVKTVRTGLGGRDDGYTRFVIKLYQHGIGAVVLVDPSANNTHKHALAPDASAGRPWGMQALSDADPQGFKKYFNAELAQLEAAGVRITAFELGNELNTPGFNGDFRPENITHRVMGINDLMNPGDTEGKAVASGYLAYLKITAVLKDLRDHSKLNQKTPILSGMSGDWDRPQHWAPGRPFPDAVSIPDSIQFLRNAGMDSLVDGYAVHIYPSGDPNISIASRAETLESRGVLSECRQGGKPCWVTEWGINNNSESCPLNDAARASAIRAERSAFAQFAEQGRLTSILFYSWSGVIWPYWDKTVRKDDVGAIFRCGALTDAGKLALSPM